jgi:uncharacterized membrane protein YfcA
VSGGIVAVSTLAFLGMSQQFAQGTSLVMQLPTTVLAFAQYARRGSLEPKPTLAIALSSFPASFLGALAATHVSSGSLRRAFALFIFTLATYMLWSTLRPERSGEGRRALALTLPAAGTLGTAGGFFSGVFGIGGAALAIPTLTLLFGVPQTTAQAMGLALVFPAVLISVVTYGAAGFVDWSAGVPLAAGSILTVSAGVACAHRLPAIALRRLFASLVYACAIALWLR